MLLLSTKILVEGMNSDMKGLRLSYTSEALCSEKLPGLAEVLWDGEIREVGTNFFFLI